MLQHWSMCHSAARYVPDYVDEAYELALLQSIDNSAWLGDLKRRHRTVIYLGLLLTACSC